MNILLHLCCGPCACYPTTVLMSKEHSFTGYFFNPNIHPYKEFKNRLNGAKELFQILNKPLICDENYYLRDFLRKALTIEKNTDGLNLDQRRCRMCYSWRMHQTATYAKEHGFDAFTSTLFVSPYQNHAMMKEIAEKVAQAVGISFYYEDFRPGFAKGTELSYEYNLYHQAYCGCIFSEEERYSNRFKKARKKKLKAIREGRLDEEFSMPLNC